MRNELLHTTLTTLFVCCLLCLPVSVLAAGMRQEKAIPEGGKAVLTFAAPLLTMTETPFSVELIGGTGKILADAAVSLRLVMPAMAMPHNSPKAIWREGAYHGTAVFTMAGEWEAIMIIQRPGHDVVDLTFKLGEVRMK
ncbi:MAG: FixH family protein [Desulfuromonadales bacterium]|nr:FixH family protein [Desulfuromonadales bacterium]